jgi:hypothetical protein
MVWEVHTVAPRDFLPLVAASVFGLCGCASIDYGLVIAQDEPGTLQYAPDLLDLGTVQISFDAAFQRTKYSEFVSRCQIELAFLLESEEDGMGENDGSARPNEQGDPSEEPRHEEDQPRGEEELEEHQENEEDESYSDEHFRIVYAPHGSALALPDNPGDCVLSIFDYGPQDNQGSGEERDDPNKGNHGSGEECDDPNKENRRDDGHACGAPEEQFQEGPARGAWKVRGSIDLGPEVVLVGAEDTWLDRSEDQDGRVFYQLLDCDAESFPFAQSLDLVVPESEIEGGLGAFTMAGVFGTGPELTLVRPGHEVTDDGVLVHSQGQHLNIAWEVDGDLPELDATEIVGEKMIWIQTSRVEDRRYEEALACRPYENVDQFLIRREWLVQMIANPLDFDNPIYDSSFQVDMRSMGTPVSTEYGEVSRISSTVTDGGQIWLEETIR